MSTTEISIEQYCEFLNNVRPDSVKTLVNVFSYYSKIRKSGDTYKTDNPKLPVILVSWYGAMAFCDWLSTRWHLTVTLPTFEQWKLVAKKYYSAPANHRFSRTLMNVCGSLESPSPVHHLLGNVKEWCIDTTRVKQPALGGAYMSSYLGNLDISLKETKPKSAKSTLIGFRIAVKVDSQLRQYLSDLSRNQ